MIFVCLPTTRQWWLLQQPYQRLSDLDRRADQGCLEAMQHRHQHADHRGRGDQRLRVHRPLCGRSYGKKPIHLHPIKQKRSDSLLWYDVKNVQIQTENPPQTNRFWSIASFLQWNTNQIASFPQWKRWELKKILRHHFGFSLATT